MTTFRRFTRRSYGADFTLDGLDIEVELQHDPVEHAEFLTHREGGKLVVAYLVYDEHAENPLENCDSMGMIIGRGKYETRRHSEVDMFEALGLNNDGEPRLDLVEDEVQAKWQDYLEGLDSDVWSAALDALGYPPPQDDDETQEAGEVMHELRAAMMDVSAIDQGSVHYIVWEACSRIDELNPTDTQRRAAADLFDFDVEAVSRQCWEDGISKGTIGNPDAVVLDVYDHSGLHWSVSGGGMQCRWDTSTGAGVWVPDECCKDEIMRRAPIYAHRWIESTNFTKGRNLTYGLYETLPDGKRNAVKMSDDWSELWKLANEICKDLPPPTEAELVRGRRRAAYELAEQALEQYNDWLSGANYGCVVETFQAHVDGEDVDDLDALPEDAEITWEQVDEDSCWGYTGTSYAEEVLKEEHFAYAVKQIKEATPV